jgi:hypothetical protein
VEIADIGSKKRDSLKMTVGEEIIYKDKNSPDFQGTQTTVGSRILGLIFA